jgi:hypothetical protein
MTFIEFWEQLTQGGVTPQGDRYSITADNLLHIISQGNQNQAYYITHVTAEKYFDAIPLTTPNDFCYNHSSYFHNVYVHITAS